VIKKLFKIIFCKVNGHLLIEAGPCPYTRKSYNLCTRCGVMIAI
jgi:hypothetical protein